MAHSGTSIFAAEALLVARLCPNVALETTWTGPHNVRHFVETIGAERVLFGSDHAVNQATELEKIRTSGINEEQIAWCLGRTDASLYRLPVQEQGSPDPKMTLNLAADPLNYL